MNRTPLLRWIGRVVAVLLLRVAQAEEPPLPVEQLVPRISAQVVQVIGAGGYGSAVVVARGQAVTSCHVLGHSNEASIVLGVEPQPITVLARDRFHDLCLLGLPSAVERPAAGCRASAKVAVGEITYAVGFASGRLGFSRGKLLARYALDGAHVLRTGAGFLPGASGGGLFDDRGRLIGVLTFLRRGGATPAYLAVPCEWIDALRGGRPSTNDGDVAAFWQLVDRGSAQAPYFMQALRLEAEERWDELLVLAERWRRAEPGDEAAASMEVLARRQLQPTRPLAELSSGEDERCVSNGGRLVSVRRIEADDARALRVWIERWHLGMRTADRTRHDFVPGAADAALGCSRTVDGEQRWEIVETRWLDR